MILNQIIDFNYTAHFIFGANRFQHFVTTETFKLKHWSKTYTSYIIHNEFQL